MRSARPLAIAVGDPAGIGPLVSARAAVAHAAGDRLVLFGDAARLAALLGATQPAVRARRIDPGAELDVGEGEIGLVHVSTWSDATVTRHEASEEGGRAQIAALDAAADAVLVGRARAIVTGPTSKEAVVRAGVRFTGQTEHLARRAGLASDAVTMMFLGPRLCLALVTTHLSVRAVPDAITPARVERTARHLGEALLASSADARPGPLRVGVAGLNPHAGEGGLFGDEEMRVIGPALDTARARPPFDAGRVVLEDVRPAEAVLRQAAAGAVDGVVVMMHDQATIASKLLDWGQAVNVTWGLPFVRTSVDHGVAYDAAARGEADADGMIAAVALAQRLVPPQETAA